MINSNLLDYQRALENDPFVSLEDQVDKLYYYMMIIKYFKDHHHDDHKDPRGDQGFNCKRWDFEELAEKLRNETKRHTLRILEDQIELIMAEERKSNTRLT